MHKKVWAALLGGMVMANATGVRAGDREELEALRQTTTELIQLLVDQGLLTREKADAMMAKAKAAAAAPSAPAAQATPKPGTVRVPYVPESVKAEIREEVRQEVVAQARAERWGVAGVAPEWTERIKLEGDIRLRAQLDGFQPDNTPVAFYQAQGQFYESGGVDLNNTTEDRQRWRARARLGVTAKVNDWAGAGLRVVTGTMTDAVSTNQTLGNNFGKFQVSLDRAYLRLDPAEWVTAWGGRMPNPWFSTDLVWDEDLNFDGVAATFKPRFTPAAVGFVTLGAFPLTEFENSHDDHWLYGAQAGLEYAPPGNWKAKFGVAYYKYTNIAGIAQPFGSAALPNYKTSEYPKGVRQKGNSIYRIDDPADPDVLYGLASDFNELAITGLVDLAHFNPTHLILSFDWVRNMGFDQAEILARTGRRLDESDTGYQAKVTLGMPVLDKQNDWQAFFGYRYVEPNAVLDAFTDSDFHLGGTDAKGYFLGGSYALDKNAWLTAKWMTADAIKGPPLAIDVFQLDLNAKF